MNKFELNIIMNVFGYEESPLYRVNECDIYHGGSYYAVVKGNTPYELALLIREKYDNDKYKIRVNGGREEEYPEKDIYTYHIDTKEGLVAYILERQNYYSASKESSNDLDNIMKTVYTKILAATDPRLSIYDWMLDRENRKEYFKSLLNVNTGLDFKLRKKIDDFDNTINPFVKGNIDLDKQNFIVDGYNGKDENYFALIDQESEVMLSTYREKEGFTIELRVPLEKPYGNYVYHYFNKGVEVLAFETYDENGISRLEYNLTCNTMSPQLGYTHQPSVKEKKLLIYNLEQYIALASKVVERNLGTKKDDAAVLNKNN